MPTSRPSRFPTQCRVILALALAGLLVAPAGAGAQRPQFQSRVELVQFQVRVTDGSGNFVPGLEAGDFQLRVDGAERAVAAAYEVILGDTATAAVPADQPPAAWRQWVLFFDAAFNTPRGVIAAQEAAREFLTNQVNSRDLVGVATFNTVVGARLVVPPTRDRAQVMDALGGLGLNAATRNVDRAGFLVRTMSESFTPGQIEVGEEGPGFITGADIDEAIAESIRQVGSLEVEQYASVVAQYADQLSTIGELLQGVRGRKHVVYFSQGFADSILTGQSLDELTATTDAIQQNAGLAIAQSSGEDRFGSAEVRSALDDALDVFRSADAVIHVVDPTGVGGGRDRTNIGGSQTSGGDFGSRGSSRSALTALASATGGEMYWDSNNLGDALSSIEEANRSYYVIAFPRQAGDEEILELDVRVSTAGAVVDAPSELAAPRDYADMSDVQKQMQLSEFISKGIEESDLVFDVAAAGFSGDESRNRLPVVIEVPWTQLEELADSGNDERIELEIFSYALDENDRMMDLSSGEVNLNMEAMRKSPAAGLPFRYYDLLWATPGERRVRVVIRDKELGRISAFTSANATIPPIGTGAVAMSGPIGVDWDHQGLIMRGFKAESPPPHKKDGPIAYPFVVGADEITPAAALSGPPGSAHYAYFVAHNLGRDENGAPRAMVALGLQSPMGEPVQLAAQEMVMRFYDADTDSTQMVVKGTLPPNLPPGLYGLMVFLEDQIKGERLSAVVPVWVEG